MDMGSGKDLLHYATHLFDGTEPNICRSIIKKVLIFSFLVESLVFITMFKLLILQVTEHVVATGIVMNGLILERLEIVEIVRVISFIEGRQECLHNDTNNTCNTIYLTTLRCKMNIKFFHEKYAARAVKNI